jgi:hypothetical protein
MTHFKNFKVVYSPKISSIGDIDENKKLILIHKNMPKKFQEGIKEHEIEERKWLKRGHSYTYSHQKAQGKELKFYEKQFRNREKAKNFLNEEEKNVNKIIIQEAKT